jgi:hypothetical protein
MANELITNYRISKYIDEMLVEAGLPELKHGGPTIYNARKTSVGLPQLEALEYAERWVARVLGKGTKAASKAPTLAELRALRAELEATEAE